MKLFEPKVRYCEIRKKYFHIENGKEFMRISHVLDSLGPKFDREGISGNIAAGTGKSKSEITDEWDAVTDEGTRKHNAIQCYSNTATVQEKDMDLLPLVKDIHSCYTGYYQSHSELTLHDEEVMWAGTTDRTNIISNRQNSMFDMEDYKCPGKNEIKDFSKQNEFLFGALSYLQNCSFVRYSLQLSIYGFMFERLTGKRLRRLGIRLIHTDNKTHQYIPVMYMKPEVEHIFKMRKQQLLQNGN